MASYAREVANDGTINFRSANSFIVLQIRLRRTFMDGNFGTWGRRKKPVSRGGRFAAGADAEDEPTALSRRSGEKAATCAGPRFAIRRGPRLKHEPNPQNKPILRSRHAGRPSKPRSLDGRTRRKARFVEGAPGGTANDFIYTAVPY